jgi:hypothetical protein
VGSRPWQHHLSPPIFDATGDGIHTRTDVYVPKLFRGEAGEVCNPAHRRSLPRRARGHLSRLAHREAPLREHVGHGAGVGAMIPDPTGAA